MGNRGKNSKGKSGKRGKGKKSGRSGGASKWGDEGLAQREDGGQPIKKKRRVTQEAQDRGRRMKIMELTRAEQREKTNRLSRPNREPLVAAPAKLKPKRRKRPRNSSKDPARVHGSRGDRAYYSSSDDDEARNSRGLTVGLASYKELLSSLEATAAGGDGDEDLAAAVAFRRLQREGREGYGSESQTEDDQDDEEDMEDEEEKNEDYDEGVEKADDVDEKVDEETARSKPKANDSRSIRAEQDGDPGATGGDGESDDDIEADDLDLDHHQDAVGNEQAGDKKNPVGRSNDEFGRHFVATPVFPREQATEMMSASRRISLKPLPASYEAMWGTVGLSVTASQNVEIPSSLPLGGRLAEDLGVLPALAAGWDGCDGGSTSSLQSLLLPPLTGYRDLLYCGWRDEEAKDIRRCYALHALNHALTSRRRVVRHNARLRKAIEEVKMAEAIAREGGGKETKKGGDDRAAVLKAAENISTSSSLIAEGVATGQTANTESDEWQRDQGFTRPKVLILLPFRGLAYELLEIMVGLLGPKTVVMNKDRFDEEYGPDLEDNAAGGEEADGTPAGEARVERARAVLERKPVDWKALMGEGRNVDDMFTLGLSLSPGGGKGKPGEGKGVAVRLYCDFYHSDIILASPVALHRACVPNEDRENGNSGGIDADFLSSVEVCVMDRADVFLMQNWAYVPDIAEVLNTHPKGERAAKVDFSRVRPLFLHEQGRLFRQTLVFSAFQDPNLNALVSKHLRNYDGVIKICRPSGNGRICDVVLQVKQVFQRVPCDSLASQDDARFEYFTGTVLPQLLRSKQSHTAVFIPSYFDYVRVRNHLMKNKASAVNVHEYSRGSEVTRSRARFFRGERDLLLYTGRAHFFNRYSIRGIHHLIFYSLPKCPQFYPEMVNLLEEAEAVTAVTCLSLFTRFERLSLGRIVGEERADHMLCSVKNTFLFC